MSKKLFFLIVFLLFTTFFAQSAVGGDDYFRLAKIPGEVKLRIVERTIVTTDGSTPLAENNATLSPFAWLSPMPQGYSLYDVGALDSNTVIAVGAKGTIIRTTDRGRTWAVSNNADNMEAIEKVSYIDGTAAYAVGWFSVRLPNAVIYRSFVLKSIDNGLTWLRIFSPNVQTQITGVHFLDANTGYIVGTNSFAARTTDGGRNWATVNITGPAMHFQTVVFHNNEIGFVGTRDGRIFRTTNGGASWSIHSLQNDNGTVFSIHFTSSTHGYLSGCDGRGIGQHNAFIYKTTDGGNSWNRVYHSASAQIYTLGFFNQSDGMAMGFKNDETNPSGLVLLTANSGTSWTELTNYSTKRRIYGSRILSQTAVMAACEGGVVMASPLRGSSWYRLSLEITDENIFQMQMVSSDSGYIACSNGVIYRTHNGGVDWTAQVVNPQAGDISRLHFINRTTGLAIFRSGKIYRTQTAGNNWNEVYAQSVSLQDIKFASQTRAYAIGQSETVNGFLLRSTDAGQTFTPAQQFNGYLLTSIHFTDSLYGYISAVSGLNKSTIFRTTNGGILWDSLPAPLPFSAFKVFFPDRFYGYTIGDRGRYARTTNGGSLWETDSLPGEQLSDINFPDAFRGALVSLSGRVYYTNDAGNDWTRAAAPISIYYRTISFIKSGRTWKSYAAGNAGAMVTAVISPFNEKLWTWGGTADSSWFNPLNWTPPRVPEFSDSVVIGLSPKPPVVNRKQQQIIISALTIKPGGRLIITDSIRAFVILGDLTVEGVIGIRDSAKIQFIVGGSWDISNSQPGAFDPGKSVVVFRKQGKIRNRFYDAMIDSAVVMKSAGPITAANGFQLYYGTLDLQKRDTLIILSDREESLSGAGIIPNGTIRRNISGGIQLTYRFESDYTYIRFKPSVFENNRRPPAAISFTTYPDTIPLNFGTRWIEIPSTVDTALNVIYADSVTLLGTYAIGTALLKERAPTVKRVVTGGASASLDLITEPFELSLRYEQSEVPPGTDESQFKILVLNENPSGLADDAVTPGIFHLEQNYPNPFNPSTVIGFSLPQSALASLEIYDVLGQLVMEIPQKEYTSGQHIYSVNAQSLAGGVYIYRLITLSADGRREFQKKFILLK